MSYLTITGDTKGVSSEKIVAGLNANGLACTGAKASGEGETRELTFALVDGEGSEYRRSLPLEVLLMRVADGLSRAGLYVCNGNEAKTLATSARSIKPIMSKAEIALTGVIGVNDKQFANVFGPGNGENSPPPIQVSNIEPPVSDPARGTLAWAELVLAGS